MQQPEVAGSLSTALSQERRKVIRDCGLSPKVASSSVAWQRWNLPLAEKRKVHAQLALRTEAAFVWIFPHLAPSDDWQSYHELARALESQSPGISAALLLSLWALQDDILRISEADGWLLRVLKIAPDRESPTGKLAEALEHKLRLQTESTVVQLCRRIFCTHPVATLVEYERWARAGILNTCRWPIWFAALTVEGAYDGKGVPLGTLCWRKNHLKGEGHLSKLAAANTKSTTA
eukprot:TRINITY_DN466_c0_g2_i1.p1 TRINITY_DN466_c0_g2~~TRINITY_DN466_c0_g2_i1.p1  ORF type:complete len:234 (+),score=27.12 TRINITY_DN466_c0_g2_i1:27-728(+)